MATAGDRVPMKDDRKAGWLIPLALLALALVALVAWLAMRGDDEGSRSVGTTKSGDEITVAELTEDDGSKFVGEQVTLTEEIDDVINESSFTLGGDSDKLNIPVVGVTDDMFVDSKAVPLEPQLRAKVEGEVVEFQQDEFAKQYGDEFSDDRYAEFDGKAALVASSIDIDPADDGGKGESNG
ncbi:MAG: hypothetical protein JWL76_2370 [Thermoleophilia bacterium]|nr:hypothetical protein [Thermoleophilia bacterium]